MYFTIEFWPAAPVWVLSLQKCHTLVNESLFASRNRVTFLNLGTNTFTVGYYFYLRFLMQNKGHLLHLAFRFGSNIYNRVVLQACSPSFKIGSNFYNRALLFQLDPTFTKTFILLQKGSYFYQNFLFSTLKKGPYFRYMVPFLKQWPTFSKDPRFNLQTPCLKSQCEKSAIPRSWIARNFFLQLQNEEITVWEKFLSEFQKVFCK